MLWQTTKYTPLPAEATPSEVTNRFHDVCTKAVSLICYSDAWPRDEAPWDFTLNYAQFTLPTHFEKHKQADACFLINSNEIFTQWIFCLLLEFLDFSLVSSCVPYHTILYHTTPYHSKHTIPYDTIPHFTISYTYHTLPEVHYTIRYHTTLYHSTAYCTRPHLTIAQHTIQYHTALYHSTAYYTATPNHTTLYHTICTAYHTIPYHTSPFHIIPTTLYRSTAYHTIPYQSYYSTSCYKIPYPYHSTFTTSYQPQHTIPDHTVPYNRVVKFTIINLYEFYFI